MIQILECDQGDAAWIEARLGVPTASNFSRIVTPSGKLSSQRQTYLAELAAEWALRIPQDQIPDLYWIERGKALETEAHAFYELQTDAETKRIGFVWQNESRLVGCSPDWLCDQSDEGWQGGAELKCPKASTHINYLLGGKGADTYAPQVQGAMWVCGVEWWDFVSYYPELPPLIVRVERDEKYQAALAEHMPVFLQEMMAARGRLEELGVTPGALRVDVREAAPPLLDAAGHPLNPLG